MSAMPDDMAAGEWVRRGLILAWCPAPAELRPFNPDLIACVCDATVTQACRTPSGSRTRPHAGRVVSRRCVCGEVVGNKAWFCDECRERRRRESQRRRNQRRWARVLRERAA